MKRKLIYIAISALLALILLAGAGWVHLGSSPMQEGEPYLYQVRPGSGFYEVAEDLSRAGVIRSIRFFKLLGRLRGVESRIKAGFYNMDSAMSASEILDVLVAGRVHSVRVTIPEGSNNRIVARILAASGLVTAEEFLAAAADAGALAAAGLGAALPAATSTEGFLFPDTYMIPWGLSAPEIVRMLLANFRRQVGSSLLERMAESPRGLHRTIILASIVEREAAVPAERASIAGVFANRVRIGMKLESCATVQYILDEVRPILLFSDLRRESPYNTYLHAGYPPGPIANPGLASIKAAADPEQHDYLYFVSRNDGTHVFSKTLSDHNRAAREFQWN